jgi:hypothetical protein
MHLQTDTKHTFKQANGTIYVIFLYLCTEHIVRDCHLLISCNVIFVHKKTFYVIIFNTQNNPYT